jgi:flagellar basal-body rod protein FlgB
VWDVTTQTVLGALQGLGLRGELRANNVANAETPGFRARTVDFESTLREAVRRGDPGSARAEATVSPTIVDARGNSVELATELIEGMKDGLKRDAMVAGFNFKSAQFRVAIGGRR